MSAAASVAPTLDRDGGHELADAPAAPAAPPPIP